MRREEMLQSRQGKMSLQSSELVGLLVNLLHLPPRRVKRRKTAVSTSTISTSGLKEMSIHGSKVCDCMVPWRDIVSHAQSLRESTKRDGESELSVQA